MPTYCRALLSILLFPLVASAQQDLPFDAGAAGLRQVIQRLQTTGTVLHVVAHPDDEDGPMLTYCARGLGCRTILFSITRGEGGANLISAEFFDQLGALRTLEHVKSAGFYGNQVRYSRATDYGYSKTIDEARNQWENGLPILRDLVAVIRRERPTVLLSRFRGDTHDGHGHHQLAGVLSQQAYVAAADPKQFADLDDPPWQINKLYSDNIRPEWRAEDRDIWTIALPTGQYAPLLGRSYAQVARYGLGFQRSQGISGHEGSAGPQVSYYRRLQSHNREPLPTREQSLFDGLDFSMAGLTRQLSSDVRPAFQEQLTQLDATISAVVAAFDAEHLDRCATHLADGLKRVRQLSDQIAEQPFSASDKVFVTQQLSRKQTEFEDALGRALALHVDVWATAESGEAGRRPSTAGFNHATPGQALFVHARLVNQGELPITSSGVALRQPATWPVSEASAESVELTPDGIHEVTMPIMIPPNATPTRPAWHRDSKREPFYEVPEDWQQRPLPAPPLHVAIQCQFADVAFELERPVMVRQRHPEFGQVRYPLTIVPSISVRIPRSHGILPRTADHYDVDVDVASAVKGRAQGEVHLAVPSGWDCEPATHDFQFDKEDDEQRFRFRLSRGLHAKEVPDDVTIEAIAEYANQQYSEGYRTITARDLSRVNLYQPAVQQLSTIDVEMLGTPRVAYIPGSGDEVAQALEMLGVRPVILNSEDLPDTDLSAFDVVVVGVRAYAVSPHIRKHNQRLIDFTKAGGVLIVQYQTPEFDQNFGPYPYSMGSRPEEVSEEDAAVTMLVPDHPLLTQPNKIEPADFDHWLEQRGSKFWETWDPAYTALLECHDADQPPQRGGMLVAKYGEGVYIYSAYAWYRQLPDGVGGAFRIFANMLSASQTMK